MTVTLLLDDASAKVDCVRVTGREQLGDGTAFDVIGRTLEPIDRAKIVGKPCALVLTNGLGERVVCGVVASATSKMVTQASAPREVRFAIRAGLARLALRRRTRVFQRMSTPDILKRVLADGGWHTDDIELRLSQTYPARVYVTQFDEDDASFVRRLCEEDGLWFRFEPRVDGEKLAERFVLEDTSKRAKDGADSALLVVARRGVSAARLVAYDPRETRARRAGRVAVRAYDPERPALTLEGLAEAGSAPEQDIEIYAAPARFASPAEGEARAKLALERARAASRVVRFRCNALSVAPGTIVELEPGAATAWPTGKFFVVEVKSAWLSRRDVHRVEIEAIPIDLPFRLPLATPRPRAVGVHTAIVTGPAGSEIHTDARGRVFVRFPWDREGPTDETSSLPVRVMQPSMPGSMAIPRVGWEVWVMFEDGDPDRPLVIGRAYNARQPPPVSLPANKTMTSLATMSSPGAAKRNAITFDDASGRQHLVMDAGHDKSTTIAGDAVVQTAKVEEHAVGGTLTESVGGSEWISVGQAFVSEVGSQTASVGGVQKIFVKGNFGVTVDSERVMIGGALVEQVGDPVQGAANLAKSAALAGAASMGKVGAFVAKGAGVAMGAYDGYKAGGAKGATQALGMSALSIAAGKVPGGDALLASVTSAASPAPWHEAKGAAGSAEAGGGGSGAKKDDTKAKGPGPGHRNQVVKGPMSETIGASYALATPGSIGWKTTGVSSFLVGGSHTTKTANAHFKTTGASSEALGSLHVKSGASIERMITGNLATEISGALKSNAGGAHQIKASGELKITVGGAMDVSGAHVSFVVGSARVSASPGGVLIEADDITITGASKQSSKTAHQ